MLVRRVCGCAESLWRECGGERQGYADDAVKSTYLEHGGRILWGVRWMWRGF